MKKIGLMIVSIVLLTGSFVFINRFQLKNFTAFNPVSEQKTEEVKSSLREVNELTFTALLCNEERVPFDEDSNTFFVPLDMNTKQWEKLEFVSGQQEYQILFAEDVTDRDKQSVVAEGEKLSLLVYDNQYCAEYYITFTGLPIIDLTTNEGFYAAEEITGTATFYDTDFTMYGTTSSEYNGHIRGNTSRMFPKKGYKINLRTTREDGSSELNKISVFGMRKDDDWILHALYNDDTKIRDRLSMEVWDSFGAKTVSEKGYYGPKMTYVEVFADNQYCGLYGLMEPVDAKQMDLADTDYSYKRKNPGSVKYKYEEFHEAYDPYTEVEGFELKEGPTGKGADLWEPMADLAAILTLSGEDFLIQESELINEQNALNLWLFIQVITGFDHIVKNVYYVARYDATLEYDYQFSFAPWDMDLTWGNVSVGEVNSVYTAFESDTFDKRIKWDVGDKLLDTNYHDSRKYVQELYANIRSTTLSDEALEEMIASLDKEVRASGAFARDKARWTDSVHADDYSELLAYAKERLAFLDEALYDEEYYDPDYNDRYEEE